MNLPWIPRSLWSAIRSSLRRAGNLPRVSRSSCCSSLTAMRRVKRSRRCEGLIQAGSIENQQPDIVTNVRRCRGPTQPSSPPMLRSPWMPMDRLWIFCSLCRHFTSLHQSQENQIIRHITLSFVRCPSSSIMSVLLSMRSHDSCSRDVRFPIPFGTLVLQSMRRCIKLLS
uniref:Uncharacterized protein n=1 Tax=Arundo donax TaxID=35708 RepID=A0A0A9EPZ5_ARUDO